MSAQKLILVTSHINHPEFKKKTHAIIVDEAEEVNKFLEAGWKVVSVTAAQIPSGNASFGYSYAIVLEKK